MSISAVRCLQAEGFPWDERAKLLAQYVEILLQWNRKINLVSFKSLQELWHLHLAEGLALTKWVEEPVVVDVGAGAGLLTVPLAIYGKQKRLIALEPKLKRGVFLRHLLHHLPLSFELIPDKVERMIHQLPLYQTRFVLRALPRWQKVLKKMVEVCSSPVKICYLGAEPEISVTIQEKIAYPLPHRDRTFAWFMNVSRET